MLYSGVNARDASDVFQRKLYAIPTVCNSRKDRFAHSNVLSVIRSRLRVSNQLSDTFEIYNRLKQGDAISPLLFNIAVKISTRSLDNGEGLVLNGITQLFVYADDVACLGVSEEILTSNTNVLIK